MVDDYTIFVGGKPFMNYVTAVVMQFTTRGASNVVIKSRGKFISRAVDVAEVVKSRFLSGQVKVNEIKIDSEEFQNKEGRTVRVSTLDIDLARIGEKVEAPAEITIKSAPKEDPVATEITEEPKTEE